MEELKRLLQQALDENMIQVILSNTRCPEKGSKVKIRPVMLRDGLYFQETLFRGTQVFHTNHKKEEMILRIAEYMEVLFRQAQVKSVCREATVLVSKKGKVTVKIKELPDKGQEKDRNISQGNDLAHNRRKNYILQEGVPMDFLVELGVQTPEGKVVRAKYDKFRQINRYLEFIEDILEELPRDRCIRIIDFGCGKSYLTFAMYYYLCRLKRREIAVTGLDLKTEVIDRCRTLAERLHYDGLSFEHGDIASYQGTGRVDMVVSLHACDTATDYALKKAVEWGAQVIMAVPCCQHEVNGQMHSSMLEPVIKYGLIKERMSALITDALRADILEQKGYDTKILEFIDMEHTPKNLLIRAVKTGKMKSAGSASDSWRSRTELEELMKFLGIRPSLYRLLME